HARRALRRLRQQGSRHVDPDVPRRRARVLIRSRLFGIALCAGPAACSQSLFDNHGPGTTGGDDTGPATCNAPCLADAAVDFDGSAGGKNQLWRYLDDHRNRTFTVMMPGPTTQTGPDPPNHITPCAATPAAAARTH